MWQHSGEAIVLASVEGRNIGRLGNREPGEGLATFAATKDQWVAVVASQENQNLELIDELIINAVDSTAEDLASAIVRAGGKAQICWDPWSAPEQLPISSLLDVVDHPITGPMRHLGSPFTIDGQRPRPTCHAPLFDQDTDAVLAEVGGLEQDTIRQLRTDGFIGGTLPPPAELGFVYD